MSRLTQILRNFTADTSCAGKTIRAGQLDREGRLTWYPVLEAYLMLLWFGVSVTRGNFCGLYERVRNFPLGPSEPAPDTVERICSAVDLACIWYWKQAMCLERSAATACLLRRHGVAAQLVIGAQRLPFKAHAWVEVEDRVVNDKPYVTEIYAVLDRC
jgi:hypothetical protein